MNERMRLGIVWSGYDAVVLLSLLWVNHHDIVLYIDRAQWPRSIKEHALVQESVQKGIATLQTHGVEQILVPPVFENALIQAGYPVLPLYDSYLQHLVFSFSRIGKVWLLDNRYTRWCSAQLIQEYQRHYILTVRQESTNHFQRSFPSRSADVSHWQFHLPYFGRRERMMDKLIKYDLRYLKDVDVDTVVITDRSQLYREKPIIHRMWSRMRFHRSTAIQKLLDPLFPVDEKTLWKPITVLTTAWCDALLASKPWKWLLGNGSYREIVCKQIE